MAREARRPVVAPLKDMERGIPGWRRIVAAAAGGARMGCWGALFRGTGASWGRITDSWPDQPDPLSSKAPPGAPGSSSRGEKEKRPRLSWDALFTERWRVRASPDRIERSWGGRGGVRPSPSAEEPLNTRRAVPNKPLTQPRASPCRP